MRIATVFLFFAVACGRDAGSEAIPGVRLGMSPRDVRDRFDAPREGTWQTKVGGVTEDTTLEWSATQKTSRTSQARFEFHLGMLVAVRAHLREASASERVDLTPKTVTVRSPEGGGTDVVLLARDCPTHHAEAEAFAARAR